MPPKKIYYAKMPPPLSRVTVIGYGMGHLLNDLCSALWFTYSLIFYSLVIGFSSVFTGVIMLIGQIADALATPAIGIWSDRSSLICLSALGKRKSWYALGTLLVLISMPFIYSPCIGFENNSVYFQLLYYSFFVVIFQFGWAAVQTVHLALVTDLTFISSERTNLLSLRNTFTVISNIAVYIMAFIVLRINSNSTLNKNDVGLFQIVVAAVLALGGISSFIFFFTVKETNHEPLIEDDERNQVAIEPQSHGYWLKKWLLYHVAAVYMGTRIYCNVIQSFVPIYLHESLKLDPYIIALGPLVMYISSFVFSLMSGVMNMYLGKKITFTVGALLGLSASIWIVFDSSDFFKTYLIYFITVLLGGGSSIMLVTVLAIVSDLIGSDTGNSAFIYGLMSFVDKLSCGIVIMLIQTFAPGNNTVYYTYTLALTCTIACIFAGIMTWFLPSALVKPQVFEQKTENDGPSTTTELQSKSSTQEERYSAASSYLQKKETSLSGKYLFTS
ncbi:major facilitator superfamily domain-containing protein 12-like isoform X3 [Cimex lectularius]|uniref:Major facilitator superfamily domain-containing protein 12-like n=1 Tax=Cimex lectularius TaxID=79782 RepID=A0A8I6S0X3_CIMLE|nr:major facilitator superfamily domain-containing protein 12-like isoform X3 [Cimex lectularius]